MRYEYDYVSAYSIDSLTQDLNIIAHSGWRTTGGILFDNDMYHMMIERAVE